MAQIKKVSKREIHWNLKGWNEGGDANVKLRQLLKKEAASFATVATEPNNYTWNYDSAGWRALSTASAEEKTAVEKELSALSARVHAVAPKYADMLMTVPNSDYIFFRLNDAGTPEVLLTGWGYTNYKKNTGTSYHQMKDRKTSAAVRFGFTVDGILQPGRNFSITTVGNQTKTLSTDAEGWFPVQLTIDSTREITDLVSGKTFQLTYINGQSDYRFDVTQKANVTFRVFENDKPSDDYEIRIEGESEPLHTVNGEVTKEYTWCPDTLIRAYCGDQDATVELHRLPEPNLVEFRFSLPEEPEEEKTELPPVHHLLPPPVPEEQLAITVVDSAGRPMSNANVSFTQNGKTQSRILDAAGRMTLPKSALTPGMPVKTSVQSASRTFAPFEWTPEEGELEYLLQETSDKEKSPVGEILAAFGLLLLSILFAWGVVEFCLGLHNALY